MNPSITITFWQYTAQISEFIDSRLVEHYMSEVFSAYCSGMGVEGAARLVQDLDGRIDL